jgi:hypothetical protein
VVERWKRLFRGVLLVDRSMKTIGGWICQENAQFPAIFIIL